MFGFFVYPNIQHFFFFYSDCADAFREPSGGDAKSDPNAPRGDNAEASPAAPTPPEGERKDNPTPTPQDPPISGDAKVGGDEKVAAAAVQEVQEENKVALSVFFFSCVYSQ